SDPGLLQSMEAIGGQIGLFLQRMSVEGERARLLAAERASRQREAFRADAASLLTASLDLSETLDGVSWLPVPFLADYCLVDVQAGTLRQTVSFHGVPQKDRRLAELYRRYPPQNDGPGGYGKLLRTGESFMVADVPEGFFNRTSVDDEQRRMLAEFGTLSLIVVPLIAHGRGLGILALGITESARRYGPEDLALAEDLASRVAMAIDNALLYTEAQESLALLNTLLASAPVGFSFFDRELRYLRVNNALASMNGVPLAEHLGRTIRDVTPALADDLEPMVRSVFESGEAVVNWEHGGTTAAAPDTVRHWMTSIYPVRLRDGALIGVGGVITEITERKRMEEALRANESLLVSQQGVLEQIATGEPLDTILHTLARFVEERIGGCHCAVVLLDEQGTHLRYAAAPTLPESFWRPLGVFPAGPDVRTCGAAICRKEVVITEDIATDPLWDASRELALSHGLHAGWSAPITAANNEVRGTITLLYREPRTPTAEDLRLAGIAARIAAIAIERQRLEESRSQKLHSLVEHMGEGVLAVDEDWQLVFVNQAALQLLNIAEAPEPGRSLANLGLPEPLSLMLESALAHGQYTPERTVFRQGDIEIDALVSPVYTELSRYGAVAVLQDVTAEAQFRRLQQSFVANVSHELRGPLASLSATLEALVDGVIPEDKRHRYLVAMLSEMERLRRLSHEVIDLTRLDSGLVQLARDEFSLGPVFESIYEKMAQRCLSAGLDLLVDPPNVRVVGDFDKVEQVVLNLLDNAVRFTPEGGSIRLFARTEEQMLRVIVADSGPGIPAEHLPYIWERFYKVDPARTLKPGSGTGLGLAIVKQTVERMGGAVAVEAEPGKGAVFSFTLPLAES
ncbi:MAG: two-component hybrid sensor and regulator, partial [Firmicutes bacterium]|nr:two-component hybrid sensor and regulator [Bacillota bacterium]